MNFTTGKTVQFDRALFALHTQTKNTFLSKKRKIRNYDSTMLKGMDTKIIY